MPGVADMYEKMVITITSPDQVITGTITGGRRFRFTIDEQRFGKYTQTELERQASTVVSRLNEGVNVGMRKILAVNDAEPIPGDKHWDARYRRYHAELQTVEGKAYSTSKRVKVTMVGTASTVSVRPGEFGKLTAQSFAGELADAAMHARHNRREHILDLKDKHFQIREVTPRPQ